MLRRSLTILGLGGTLLAGAASAQTPATPPGATLIVQREADFTAVSVGRTTQAINYRPRQGETKVDFAGTALLPGAKGEATISGEKGYMRIDARFDKLKAPGQFGREYLTYVLWAISPEGRAKNLGEVQYDDSDARVRVTTDLQAFALIVTAEPYFAVSQPSELVVLENLIREDTKGRAEFVQAKYQALQRGTYLMKRDAAQLKVKALEPGAPLDLAEARNAVELARLAGADSFASDSFIKASRLLEEAELARERKRNKNQVMMPARQAVQTAEEARTLSLQKQEEAFQAAQRAEAAERERAALARERDALDRARAEEARRVGAEQTARLEQEQRRQAELDAQARTAAADRERAEAEAARRAAEAQAQQAQATAAQAERDKEALRARIQEQLNVILETRESARGLIVNLSDVLFDTASASLKPGAREKLARVAGVLGAQPGLHVSVEGHTDSVGGSAYNQRLSEERAQSVRDYLLRQGIAPAAVGTSGFGEDQPVATNDTAAGRQQNRRVELVVTGAPIGR